MYSTIIRQQHIIDRTEQERHLNLVNILENVFVFIEILFKMLLFKGGVLIYAEHCIYIYIHTFIHSRQ